MDTEEKAKKEAEEKARLAAEEKQKEMEAKSQAEEGAAGKTEKKTSGEAKNQVNGTRTNKSDNPRGKNSKSEKSSGEKQQNGEYSFTGGTLSLGYQWHNERKLANNGTYVVGSLSQVCLVFPAAADHTSLGPGSHEDPIRWSQRLA